MVANIQTSPRIAREIPAVSTRGVSVPDLAAGAPPGAVYTAGEALWLLSLGRDHAIAADSDPACWSGRLGHVGGGSDDAPVLVIARWHDVQAAAECHLAPRDRQLLLSRADGATEYEIAADMKVSQATAHRYVATALVRLMDALGGEVSQEAGWRTPACLACGERQRARIVAPREKGKPRATRAISVCAECASPAFRRRLV